ncbi:MAG: diguanylate cyclase [Spirochaetales bacterium]|nr:diguanylate cyclase [Spirochaetales bacterium]
MGKGKTPTIGLFINWLDSDYHDQMLRGFQSAVRERRFNGLVFSGGAIRAINRQVQTRNILFNRAFFRLLDGIVFSISDLNFFTSTDQKAEFMAGFSGIPTISVCHVLPGYTSVVVENETGVTDLINHFIRVHGYRRIAVIKGPEEQYDAQSRFRAYCRTLEANGISLDPALVLQGNFQETGGVQAVTELLDVRKKPVEAIFATNDNMAIGAISELASRGIRVPEDIAVAGFDDLARCLSIYPTITSIAQPVSELTATAVRILDSIIKDGKGPDNIKIPTKLVIRRSCGCPNPFTGAGSESQRHSVVITERDDSMKEDAAGLESSLEAVAREAEADPERDAIVGEIIRLFLSAVRGGSPAGFPLAFEQAIGSHILRYGKPEFWHEILSGLQECFLAHLRNKGDQVTILTRVNEARQVLVGLERQYTLHREAGEGGQLSLYRSIMTGLLTCHTMDDLLGFIRNQLSDVHLRRLYCTLFMPDTEQDPEGVPAESKLVFAYDRDDNGKAAQAMPVFPTNELLPQNIMEGSSSLNLIIEPLMYKDRRLGLAFFEFTDDADTYVFFMLRMVMSNVLNALIFVNKLEQSFADLRSKNLQIGKLSFAVEHSASLISITDTEGKIEYANPKFLAFHGYILEGITGKKTAILKAGQTSEETYAELWQTIKSGEEWRGELLNRKADGETYWALTVISPVRDQEGKITNFVSIQEDITAIKAKEELLLIQKRNLTELANLDSLTGLCNRRRFQELGGLLLAESKANGTFLSAMMMDIDLFKVVNDTYGHDKGDSVLKAVSLACAKTLRECDIIGRFGGDEFAVILPGVNLADAAGIAERIRELIELIEFNFDGKRIGVTISVGVTQMADDGASLKELLDRADKALYRAKRLGRNRVETSDGGKA